MARTALTQTAKTKLKPKPKYAKLLHAELPIYAKGDAAFEPLAVSIATALSEWEAMDERLSFIFVALVQSKNGAAFAAYGSLNSFGTQIKMIRAASEAVFRTGHPLRSRIATLTNELQHLHAKRSNIAHGVIRQFVSHTTDKRGRSRPKASGFFLTPPLHNTKKQLSIDAMNELVRERPHAINEFHRWRTFAYTSKQITYIAKAFVYYQTQAVSLHMDLLGEMKKRESERVSKIQQLATDRKERGR